MVKTLDPESYEETESEASPPIAPSLPSSFSTEFTKKESAIPSCLPEVMWNTKLKTRACVQLPISELNLRFSPSR
jgi:hypothetical protein